jgi:hypothetical protein
MPMYSTVYLRNNYTVQSDYLWALCDSLLPYETEQKILDKTQAPCCYSVCTVCVGHFVRVGGGGQDYFKKSNSGKCSRLCP